MPRNRNRSNRGNRRRVRLGLTRNGTLRNNMVSSQPVGLGPQSTIQPNANGGTRNPRRRRRRNRANNGNGGSTGILSGLGNSLGKTVGALAPSLLRGIAKITGMGDYVVSGLPNQNTLAGTSPPAFGSIGGMTRVRHREFIQDIQSSTSFQLLRWNLNPGLAGLFPWLHAMASNFEQYRIHGFCVEFKSTSATALNSTNTALGVVGLVTQYDATDPEFPNKQAFENYEGAQTCNPSQSMIHFIECAPRTNVLDKMYLRDDNAVDVDLKFYDMGVINLMTQGMQAVNTIGELWVSYDVEFYKPKLPVSGVGDPSTDVYSQIPVSSSLPYGTVAFSYIPTAGTLGTSWSVSQSGSYGRLLLGEATPAGSYFVTLLFTDFSNSNTAPVGSITVSSSSDITALTTIPLKIAPSNVAVTYGGVTGVATMTYGFKYDPTIPVFQTYVQFVYALNWATAGNVKIVLSHIPVQITQKEIDNRCNVLAISDDVIMEESF